MNSAQLPTKAGSFHYDSASTANDSSSGAEPIVGVSANQRTAKRVSWNESKNTIHQYDEGSRVQGRRRRRRIARAQQKESIS